VLYATLQQQDSAAGLSIAEWHLLSAQPQPSISSDDRSSDEPQRDEQRQRLLKYAGVISLGYADPEDRSNDL
jgi:hypothetical protein